MPMTLTKQAKKLTVDLPENFFDVKKVILDKIKKNGGWVNPHSHIDRAFTLTQNNFSWRNKSVEEKWHLHDDFKRRSTVDDYYRNMCLAIELMLKQGVKYSGSYIDVDPVIEDKAMKAAQRAREAYKDDITIKFVTQTFKGIFSQEARYWFDAGSEFVDIVGGTPRSERGREAEYMDVIFEKAKQMNKMVHLHVDEMHWKVEQETKLLAEKTIEHGWQGKVVGIHGISINMHSERYRQALYKKMAKAKMMMVCCANAWIDTQRSKEKVEFHNSVTPVDEMLRHGLVVGVATDNIADSTLPFSTGDMWQELDLIAKVYSKTPEVSAIDNLVKMATENGRHILDVEDEYQTKKAQKKTTPAETKVPGINQPSGRV